METKSVNVIPEGKTQVYHASYGDNGRVIRCDLFDGMSGYDLDGTEMLTLRYVKPNGAHSSVAVVNTGDDYVDITIPDSMTDIVGVVYCKLRINGIGAKAMYLSVEREV